MIEPTQAARASITRWLDRLVIGLNLCPFARAPHRGGLVHIEVIEGPLDFESCVREVLSSTEELLELEPTARSTTLCVFAQALVEFEELLDVVDALEALLEESGADALIQIAHFHPNYLFEGEPPEDVSHFTNRSPYPVVHLLRVEEVADAIASMPGIEDVPERNIERLRSIDRRHLEELSSGLDALE